MINFNFRVRLILLSVLIKMCSSRKDENLEEGFTKEKNLEEEKIKIKRDKNQFMGKRCRLKHKLLEVYVDDVDH